MCRADTKRLHSQAAASVLLAVALCAADQPRLIAQGAAAATIKAAFLYNFAKFTQWPAAALAPGQRLTLCVVGDRSVADALEMTIKGRLVEGHELSAQVIDVDGPLQSCHLLYVDGRDGQRAAKLIDALRGVPVFSVSDGDRFAENGGIAQLVVERDRMRFAINVTAAERARLHLSSRLLSLAHVIRELPNDSR